jgi:hypothetical protein
MNSGAPGGIADREMGRRRRPFRLHPNPASASISTERLTGSLLPPSRRPGHPVVCAGSTGSATVSGPARTPEPETSSRHRKSIPALPGTALLHATGSTILPRPITTTPGASSTERTTQPPRLSRATASSDILIPDAALDCAVGLAPRSGSRARPGRANCVIGGCGAGPASAPILLMTWFGMLEGPDAAGRRRYAEREDRKVPLRNFRYSSPPMVPRRNAGFPLPDALHIPSGKLVLTGRIQRDRGEHPHPSCAADRPSWAAIEIPTRQLIAPVRDPTVPAISRETGTGSASTRPGAGWRRSTRDPGGRAVRPRSRPAARPCELRERECRICEGKCWGSWAAWGRSPPRSS